MTDMQSYYEKIKNLKARLVDIAQPQSIARGSIELELQMQYCAHNVEVYTRLKVHASTKAASLDKEYSEAYLVKCKELTDEILEEMSVTRSMKDKIIKNMLADIQYKKDETNSALRYFDDMRNTMIEFINIYKRLMYDENRARQ